MGPLKCGNVKCGLLLFLQAAASVCSAVVMVDLACLSWQQCFVILSSLAPSQALLPCASLSQCAESYGCPCLLRAQALSCTSPFQRERVASALLKPGYITSLLDLFRVRGRCRGGKCERADGRWEGS